MNGDVISQTVFADVLDGMFGTQATTGLQGQVQRGVEAAGLGKDIIAHPILSTAKLAAKGIEYAQNITPEAKIAALKALIGAAK